MFLRTFMFIIIWAAITTVVAATAWLCRRRGYVLYAVLITFYTAVASVAFGLASSYGHPTLRFIEAQAVTFAPWTILYLLIPGLMVKKSSFESIATATMFITLVAVPTWFVYAVLAYCYMGQDCV